MINMTTATPPAAAGMPVPSTSTNASETNTSK